MSNPLSRAAVAAGTTVLITGLVTALGTGTGHADDPNADIKNTPDCAPTVLLSPGAHVEPTHCSGLTIVGQNADKNDTDKTSTLSGLLGLINQ
ncbi:MULTISPECIES: hypothetical protein [Actinomadura]|uniref:Secreted protein n=1 Tax=Actinomadura yumaensis TaxID=111807 RepID=A0ABW2CM78_9ACTN|nr:hypothetical protein [Actinomadura sp. J1-007]MWK38539.1 hypothetical protein [Actinomadura sp. J1-007]